VVARRIKKKECGAHLRRIKLCTEVAQFSMGFSVIVEECLLVLCILLCIYLRVSQYYYFIASESPAINGEQTSYLE
jgi:hypothetical protein